MNDPTGRCAPVEGSLMDHNLTRTTMNDIHLTRLPNGRFARPSRPISFTRARRAWRTEMVLTLTTIACLLFLALFA